MFTEVDVFTLFRSSIHPLIPLSIPAANSLGILIIPGMGMGKKKNEKHTERRRMKSDILNLGHALQAHQSNSLVTGSLDRTPSW